MVCGCTVQCGPKMLEADRIKSERRQHREIMDEAERLLAEEDDVLAPVLMPSQPPIPHAAMSFPDARGVSLSLSPAPLHAPVTVADLNAAAAAALAEARTVRLSPRKAIAVNQTTTPPVDGSTAARTSTTPDPTAAPVSVPADPDNAALAPTHVSTSSSASKRSHHRGGDGDGDGGESANRAANRTRRKHTTALAKSAEQIAAHHRQGRLQDLAVHNALKTRQLKMLRKYFGGWRDLAREHSDLVRQFRYRGDFRLLQATWSIWREQARAKKQKQAADSIKATLVHEQQSLQIARDFNNSRLLATTFFAWRRWAKRHKAKKLQAASERDTQGRMQRLLDAVARKTAGTGAGAGAGAAGAAEAADPDARRVARLQRKALRHDKKAAIMKRVKVGKITIEEGLGMIAALDRAGPGAGARADDLQPAAAPQGRRSKVKRSTSRRVPDGGGIAADPVTAAFETASAAAAAAVAAAETKYAAGGGVGGGGPAENREDDVEDEVIMLTAAGAGDAVGGVGGGGSGEGAVGAGDGSDSGANPSVVLGAPRAATERTRRSRSTTAATGARNVATSGTSAADSIPRVPLSKQPTALTKMEERARRRQDLKDARLERQRAKRIQDEAEHLAEQQRVLDAEAAERKARIRSRRAKLKEDEDKRLATERQRTDGKRKLVLADRHYQRTLLRRYGWEPWTRMLASLKRDSEVAQQHHASSVARKAFTVWQAKTSSIVAAKESKADGHRNDLVLRRCFQAWSKLSEHRRGQTILARRFNDRRLMVSTVARWKQFADAERQRMALLERKARAMRLKNLKRRGLWAWLRFVPESRLEKKRESRRALLRSKVATWLPDYKPSAPD